METQRLLGTKDGKKVYGTYTRDGQCSLPVLKISGKTYRGSSLGPCNAICKPNTEDVSYWRSLAKGDGLID